MKKNLGSLRVEEQTIENMKQAIKKYNETNIMPFDEAEFRRLAIELLAQIILQDKPIPIKLR